jgi:hypothetical protein
MKEICPEKRGPCVLYWNGRCLNRLHIPGQCPLVKPESISEVAPA